MSNHTPGPWKSSCEIGSGARIHYIRAGKSAAYLASEGCTFEVETKRAVGMTEAEVSANAALIAAAPDLLAALEENYKQLAFLAIEEGYPEDWSPLEQARAAIAKAKGE